MAVGTHGETQATAGAPEAPDARGIAEVASRLVAYAEAHGITEPQDRRWAYNRILDAAGQTGPAPLPWEQAQRQAARDGYDFEQDLAAMAEAAVAAGVAEDTASGRDRAAMGVMGSIMARPSEVARRFEGLRAAKGPVAATDWFYRLCCDVGYVRRSAIARNLAWTAPTRWGELEITINKSKPEKDPRDIAAAGRAGTGDAYPACALCRENEGYPGRPASDLGGHAARQNLRIIPIELGGEGFGLQYSPYAYYGEHCIVMSDEHRPMHVDRSTLGRLLDFVDLFPHYFIGSNADLPIVGGSILSHDHFQGGRHVFAMTRAEVAEPFALAAFPHVEAGILRWPLSVLRLASEDRGQLLDTAVHVLEVWRGWDDPAAGVVSRDADGTPHNTVTPICRMRDGRYELDLALRCNVTSAEHPLGVFHPHEELWHIKKENIGLIEVMGLAILPPRLEGELGAVRDCLARGELASLEADERCRTHASWARDVAARHPELVGASKDVATRILRDEVGQAFAHVLEDAGVFKWDGAGRAAQRRFVEAL